MMKKSMIVSVATLAVLCLFGEWSQEDAQVELSSAIAQWGVDADAFMNAVDSAYGSAYNSSDKSQFLCNWYCSILDLHVSPTVRLADSNIWLRAKTHAIRELGNSDAIKNSTNCWFAAAREYAGLNLLDSQEWYQIAGVEQTVDGIFPDGVVLVNSPFRMDDTSVESRAYAQRNRDAHEMKRNLSLAKSAIGRDLQEAVSSSAFTSLDIPEQNAVVSNIVAMACFSQGEAASLGLTNRVGSVSQ